MVATIYNNMLIFVISVGSSALRIEKNRLLLSEEKTDSPINAVVSCQHSDANLFVSVIQFTKPYLKTVKGKIYYRRLNETVDPGQMSKKLVSKNLHLNYAHLN